MSVYIKGMEMPTSCPCELLGIGYDLFCSFAEGIPARVKEYYECCQNDTRPSWCPLIPVPPHGRLIDADAAVRNGWGISRTYSASPIETVYEAKTMDALPTIIPADKEGE